MITDKFNVMQIIRETYNDEDMDFVRVKNFTKRKFRAAHKISKIL